MQNGFYIKGKDGKMRFVPFESGDKRDPNENAVILGSVATPESDSGQVPLLNSSKVTGSRQGGARVTEPKKLQANLELAPPPERKALPTILHPLAEEKETQTAEQVVNSCAISVDDPTRRRRLVNVVASYLQGQSTESELKDVFLRPHKIGGLGLTNEQADKCSVILNQAISKMSDKETSDKKVNVIPAKTGIQDSSKKWIPDPTSAKAMAGRQVGNDNKVSETTKEESSFWLRPESNDSGQAGMTAPVESKNLQPSKSPVTPKEPSLMDRLDKMVRQREVDKIQEAKKQERARKLIEEERRHEVQERVRVAVEEERKKRIMNEKTVILGSAATPESDSGQVPLLNSSKVTGSRQGGARVTAPMLPKNLPPTTYHLPPKAPSPPPKPQKESLRPAQTISPEQGARVTTKLTSLEDELSLDVITFRKLGSDTAQVVNAIRERFATLEKENYVRKLKGMAKWKASPVMAEYMAIGRGVIEKGLPIENVIRDRQANGVVTITPQEFRAIMELNKELES